MAIEEDLRPVGSKASDVFGPVALPAILGRCERIAGKAVEFMIIGCRERMIILSINVCREKDAQ